MPAGNSPKIESGEKLYNLFLDYVANSIKRQRFLNIAGFCRFIDIHKDTYYNYKENFYTDDIKRIETILEDEVINSRAASDTMKIFYLKNKFGYKDKQEVESHNKNENINQDITNMTAEERKARISDLLKKVDK